MSKVWKYHYQLQPLPRWAQKIWWTLVHKQQSESDSYWLTQLDIFGRLHFSPQGVLHPEICIHARDWPKQPSAYPNWDRDPPKKFNRENLKFGLQFSIWATITPDLVGVSSWNFFQSTCRRAGVIKRVQFSEGPPPKICHGEKKRPKFGVILTTFDFDREYLRNGSSCQKSENTTINYNPFHVGPKKSVNFGPQTTEWKWLILTNPSGHFSGDYISAIRACYPLKFLSALEIDQG